MRITVCQHLTDVTNSFKSSKLKEQLNEHQVKLQKVQEKPFDNRKFFQHIVVEQTVEDLIQFEINSYSVLSTYKVSV